jgi:hypothetical protein
MGIGIFTDKSHPPTMKQILDALGDQRSAWEEFVTFVRAKYPSQEEWKFYGKNYGWALRFRKSGKALLSLYPAQDSFIVQVILSEATAQATRDLKLGKRVRQVIERAHPFPEGRWLYIPIKSKKDVKDVQQLLALKFGTDERRD